MAVNVADWVIVALVLVSTAISFWRGFAREAMSLLTWTVALVIAMVFGERLAAVLAPYIGLPGLRLILAFSGLFIATLVVGAAVAFLVGELVDLTGLTGTDRALGCVFGLVRGAILVLAVLIMLQPVLRTEQHRWWQQSRLIPHFLMMEDWARDTGRELSALWQRIIQKA